MAMAGRHNLTIYKLSAVNLSILDQFASHNEILSDITLSSRPHNARMDSRVVRMTVTSILTKLE